MALIFPNRRKKIERVNFRTDAELLEKLDFLVLEAKRTDEKASRSSVIETLIQQAKLGKTVTKYKR